MSGRWAIPPSANIDSMAATPVDLAPPAARRLSPLRDLWPFLRPYRKQVALAFVLLCLGSGTLLLVPLAFRDLIDVGFGQRPQGGLMGNLSLDGHFAAMFGLAAFWALAVSARYYTVTWVGERVTADLRVAVYRQVLRQSPQFFETLQTGEVLSRLTGDTTLIQTVVGSSVSMGLRSLFQFIGGMIMLAVTSFTLFSLNLPRADEVRMVRAFNKLLWLQNDLINRHYAESREPAVAA